MMKLGRVHSIFKNKILIIEAGRRIPRIGDPVFGPDLHPIGRVVDVIGRVDSPYVLVKPFKEEGISWLLKRTVYYKHARRELGFKRRRT